MGEGDLSRLDKIIAASFGLINMCLFLTAEIIFWTHLDLSTIVYLGLSLLSLLRTPRQKTVLMTS